MCVCVLIRRVLSSSGLLLMFIRRLARPIGVGQKPSGVKGRSAAGWKGRRDLRQRRTEIRDTGLDLTASVIVRELDELVEREED